MLKLTSALFFAKARLVGRCAMSTLMVSQRLSLGEEAYAESTKKKVIAAWSKLFKKDLRNVASRCKSFA